MDYMSISGLCCSHLLVACEVSRVDLSGILGLGEFKKTLNVNTIIVNIWLIKIKIRWKYSVKECLFDGNITFVLKGSHEKKYICIEQL